MTTNEIRTKFLNFFKSQGHSIIASDSLVPKDDPTVLFTTAGMQQFKPQFLGHTDGFTRAATCQKCLRTDDLDVVGKTDFHHTFFEMLGNFSFGDYFKKEAIHWAWEFLTGELKLPKEKLWVSVYQEDTEAYGIWANEIKIPKERIVKLGDKSNFWPSNARLNGPNGPCGPCSEIFFDYGVNPHCPKGQACDPDCSCGRFSEVWNLVFTQYNRKEGGILEPLPAKNIDTGMGLERLAAVVQGKKSNYETDNFVRIIQKIDEITEEKSANLTREEKRIIADHIRAIVFAIADGVIPSNKERGSIVKKLITAIADIELRKTGMVFSYYLAPIVVELMGNVYPELLNDKGELAITSYIHLTEEDYKEVFNTQIPKLKGYIEQIQNRTTLSREEQNQEIGHLVFLFRDTYGLSPSTIKLALDLKNIEEHDQKVIFGVYDHLMKAQQERSRASSKMAGDVFANQDFTLNLPKTEFLGYKETKADAQVLKILNGQGEVPQANQGQAVKIILNRTPFYAEAGGQVGDSGYLLFANGKARVTDTYKTNDIYIHSGVIEQGSLKTGDKVQAVIDEPRRRAIMRNHTATHLLQAALREVLGTHIKQQGSLVEEGRLRFDFTHPKGVSPQEIKKIEDRINEFIRRADPVTTEVLTLEEAKKKGALAFFAEKYGQTVRVLSIGDYSREFCGGTHVSSIRDIEVMKIISEGSVAQGIRRVEAVTGKKDVEEFLKKKQQELAIMEMGERKKQQEKENQNAYFEKLKSSVDEMIEAGENVKGANLIIRSLEGIDIALLRKLSDLLKQKVKSGVFILGAKGPEDASVILSVTDDLVARGIKANELMNQITPLMDGSGGGRPQLAQAGSKNPQKLDGALAKAKEIVSMSLRKIP
jgi:alanyl-tRNA synthetase